MPLIPPFTELATASEPRLDLLALSLAHELSGDAVDSAGTLAELDLLGAELMDAGARTDGSPEALARACGRTLGVEHGFTGDEDDYDNPDNSMIDLVLARRRGLPILLSTIYVAAARRAGIALEPVGLPGHFVVAHFGADPPIVLDPFAGGSVLPLAAPEEVMRPWSAQDVAMRMLNNLVGSYGRRGQLGEAIRAAAMRTMLPVDADERAGLEFELRTIQARLN